MTSPMTLLRSLIALPIFVVTTIVGSIAAVIAGVDRTGNLVFAIARVWSRITLGVPGVSVETKLHAPLDPKRPYVFMPNHTSMVDIWAMFLGVPVPFRFIAKKQLGAIPLFGWAMRAGRFIFIDRQNATSARKSIREASRRIGGGQSVVIFPEGTRTRDGSLGAFKKGGFHLAMDSGVEIVPVAIRGTLGVMPRGAARICSGRVTLELGEPIPTADVPAAERDALIARVRDRVAEMLAAPASGPSSRSG